MKTYISGILGAVALAFSFVALSSAQDLTLKTDAEIEAMGYYHVYSLSIPDQPNFRNGAPYSVDNSKSLNLGPIESVAYRLNLGEDNFCYASFDTFTSSLSKIGVPTYTSHSIQQKYVHNLYYEAKSSSLNTTGTTVSKGNIEFWPWNYDRGNTAGIPNANPNGTNVFDFGDELKIEGEHGSMQVHDYQNQTTVFSFNRWNEGQIATLGIGNCTTANPSTNTVEPDWTFTYNANTYQTKQLDVYAKPVFSQAFYDNVSSQDLATVSNEISNMKLVYKLDCPLQGQYSANNYFINNASELSGMPLKRVGYYMVLEKADGTDYAYASFDAPTNNVNEIGLPFAGSNWYHQGTVSNMTVQSNVDGVVNGTGIATGNIEIWNTNYISNNSYPDSSNPEISHSIPGANSGRYDFGDERSGGDYACFQIHNYGAGQTVMALNKWNGQAKDNSSIDIGIGNNTGPGDPDYTFNGNDINTSNASKYQNRTLYVMAEASLAPCMENVDSASSYKMVQGARLTSQMGTNLHTVGVDYDIVNNVDTFKQNYGPFDRVGYYMEYAPGYNDDLRYVFVSFDAMTSDISKIGVPVAGTGEFYQRTVSNMEVTTNVPANEGLIYEPGASNQATAHQTYAHQTGYLEFWPSNYGNGKGTVISEGDDGAFDFNDSGANGNDAGHGSMQIHSLNTQQTIFALNGLNQTKQFGIGNNPNGQPDWTFDTGKAGYAIANIYTFAKPVLSDMNPEHFQEIQSEAANMELIYKMDCPLYGTYSADNYTINNANNLPDSMKGMPIGRVAYYMTLEKADGSGTDYAYASFDSVTNNPAKLGLPFDGSVFQGKVNNLTVSSNVDGVVNGTGLQGNIEMWNRNYSQGNSAGIPGANDSTWDFGDVPAPDNNPGNYASFQIHNYGNQQTVMALNAWNGFATSPDRTIDIGIGNNSPNNVPLTQPSSPDYTFDGERGTNSVASQYANRTLYVMADVALAPGMEYVANGSEYTMVQGARLTTQMNTNWHNGFNYDIVNNVASLQAQGILFDRVGYYMEYAATMDDPLSYVFVSFDAMTSDISKLGVPVAGSGEFYQQTVSNMEVTTNVPSSQGLLYAPGTSEQAKAHQTYTHTTGYLEFWPSNYGAAKSGIISVGADNAFDLNDSGGNDHDAGHGSMQIHSVDTQQTIFALNSFNTENPKSYGIGTNPRATPFTGQIAPQADWTFDGNVEGNKVGYQIANIYTFVHEVDALLTTRAFSMFQRNLNNTADVKLAGKWAVSNGITIDTLQASVDGGDWLNLTMNSDGTFTGTTSLIAGMHSVEYQALDANGNVIATQSGQIGVGEIFITAGQSNSTNSGDVCQTSTSPMSFAYNPKTGEWQHNADPQQGPLDNSTGGSTWPAFADTMTDLEDVPVATYSVGYGGTSQAQWASDWNGIYSNLKAAMEFLNENADGFAGILWHQGESDAGSGEDYYYNMLNALIARTRTDSGNENLPWGVAIASADSAGNTYANVTNAQERVIADDPMVFLGVNTDEFSRDLRGNGNNSIHLSDAGLKEAGRLWATTAGEDIVALRKYWRADSPEALSISDWEVNGGYKLGIKLVSGEALSVETSNNVQMLNDGTMEVGENYNLTLTGTLSGPGELEKTGKGAATLSGDSSEFTGKTKVSEGSLTLSGNAVNANGPVEVASDAILVYHVDGDDSKQLTFSDDVTLTGGNVIKTGTGKLKIKAAGTQFSASQFTVEAGELDFYGDYNGDMEIQDGATLSPGNSVGNLIVVGNVVVDSGASALFEFGAYNPDDLKYDTLTIADDYNSFELADGSVINLSFEGDPVLWAGEGSRYQLVFDNGFASGDTLLNSFLGNYQDLFALEGTPEGLFLLGLGAGPIPPGPGPEPGTGVPEPSTWALLLLGTAGLFWLRRKNSLQKNS